MKRRALMYSMIVFLLLIIMPRGGLKADEAPVITRQPEDVVVSYPDGATFSVEVTDPDAVALRKI
ncbi:MAG: hypothetical protein K6A77_05070 [Clostridiales bacterium]|nr:hypothetical protein [Clostridiales bacterium]